MTEAHREAKVALIQEFYVNTNCDHEDAEKIVLGLIEIAREEAKTEMRKEIQEQYSQKITGDPSPPLCLWHLCLTHLAPGGDLIRRVTLASFRTTREADIAQRAIGRLPEGWHSIAYGPRTSPPAEL